MLSQLEMPPGCLPHKNGPRKRSTPKDKTQHKLIALKQSIKALSLSPGCAGHFFA